MKKIKVETSFKQLHDAGACKDRYKHLARALGGIAKYGRTKPINLLQILEHNGLDDFFWALGTVPTNEIFRLMACDFAESVLPIFEKQYPDDSRPREAINTGRLFAIGEATNEQRAAAGAAAGAARAAAWDAAWAAARAAGAAAWDAARAAAWDAAWAAARAAGAAAWDAARAAAWDAEREKQIVVIKKYLK